MKNQIFSFSENGKHEYCCTIVKIGKLKPIAGKDRIVSTLVNGVSMVVRKDQVHEGDVMFYAMNETQLSEKFLAANNLYSIDEYEKNTNAVEVGKLIFNGKIEEAKNKCGFFNKYGRVKLIRLGSIPSYGYIFSIQELAKVYPEISNINFEEMIGTDFDTVCNEIFIKAYVPPVKEVTKINEKQKRNKKINLFDRLIPGKFSFHYDTAQLTRCIKQINPTDSLTISCKIHGTSLCIGNVLTKSPKYGGIYSKFFNYLPKFLQFTYEKYDIIYSSRTVIKNKYISNKVGNGYYETDIWGEYAELLKGKIPQGMMLYGEIFGYLTGDTKMIQKDYDYGCPVGTNKLMVYRISTETKDGTKKEWNVQEVYEWTNDLIKKFPELEKHIHPIDILYHGTLVDLYPEIDIHNHWHENVLDTLKKDKKHFGMELNKPLCKKKVAREGIVVRIDDDPINEAFKLKTDAFFARESKLIDSGEIDIEMENAFL